MQNKKFSLYIEELFGFRTELAEVINILKDYVDSKINKNEEEQEVDISHLIKINKNLKKIWHSHLAKNILEDRLSLRFESEGWKHIFFDHKNIVLLK